MSVDSTRPGQLTGRVTLAPGFGGYVIASEKVTPLQYDRWSEERRASVEIADGRITTAAVASTVRRRTARAIANALDTAGGPEWNADVAVEIRLTDAPLTVRRPDVVVYRADAINATPLRAQHVLGVVELVSRASQTTGRIVGVHRYVRAGIEHYWRVEWSATGAPVVCVYVLDPMSGAYREEAICGGLVHVTTPFPVTIDLTRL